jgi:hypothetical protein
VLFKPEEISPTIFSTASNSSLASDKSLSTGEKAGIGVGAVLGFLTLLALGFYLYHRRAKSQRNQTVLLECQPNEYRFELNNETIPPRELPATQNYLYHEVNSLNCAQLAFEVNQTNPIELEAQTR